MLFIYPSTGAFLIDGTNGPLLLHHQTGLAAGVIVGPDGCRLVAEFLVERDGAGVGAADGELYDRGFEGGLGRFQQAAAGALALKIGVNAEGGDPGVALAGARVAHDEAYQAVAADGFEPDAAADEAEENFDEAPGVRTEAGLLQARDGQEVAPGGGEDLKGTIHAVGRHRGEFIPDWALSV